MRTNELLRMIVMLAVCCAANPAYTQDMPRVVFEFSSPQFRIESGQVMLLRIMSGLDWTVTTLDGKTLVSSAGPGAADLEDHPIRRSETRPLSVAGPGPLTAVLGEVTLVRNTDQSKIEIDQVSVNAEVTADDIRVGRSRIVIDAPQLLIVRVEDNRGRPVPDARVSISRDAMEGGSEGVTSQTGEVVLLGMVGRYFVTMAAPGASLDARHHETFEIQPTDSGERVVVFRIPSK